MLYRLRAGMLPVPKVYIAENRADVRVAKENGLPYIKKSNGIDDYTLLKVIMLPTLSKMFPYIDWVKQLGIGQVYKTLIVKVPGGECDVSKHSMKSDSGIADIASERREFSGTQGEADMDVKLADYAGDLSSKVNIEQLQDMMLLPSFLSDIATNINQNLYGSKVWNDGYNKKLNACIGNYDQAYEAGNLMILDISNSIPRGISATMLTLIETLREQANADLIITGSTSMWFPKQQELPSPEWIRKHIGYRNESEEFFKILIDNVFGKHWGNVIAFGDYDCPNRVQNYFDCKYNRISKNASYENTSVEKVWNYHTCADNHVGYANWVYDILGNEVPSEYNTSWCSIIGRHKHEYQC